MTGGVIDVERHVLVPSLDDLLPYVDESWRARIAGGEFALPPAGPHPGVQVEARPVEGARDPWETSAAIGDDVEAVLLSAPQGLVTHGWLNHGMAAVFSTALNAFVVEHWLPVDARFRFAVVVAPHDGARAAEEVRRWSEHPGAAAVCLSPVAVNLGQAHYHPIYEAAAEAGLPVIVHPGGFEGSVVGPAVLGGVGPWTPEETFSLLPQVAMSNVASLIYDGIFERFPGLTVVFAGFGFGWAVPLGWRADAEWRGLRVEVPWLTRPPSEVLADHIRLVVDGACELSPDAWRLAAMLPPGVLLHGSDAPYETDVAARIRDGAPEALRALVLRGNAAAAFPRLRGGPLAG